MIPIISVEEYRQNLSNQETEKVSAITVIVDAIQQEVKKNGDEALHHYARQLDKVEGTEFLLKVSREEIKSAYNHVSGEVVQALKLARNNIIKFHQHQVPKSWQETDSEGITTGMIYQPIPKVGLYVPGGRALYPSSVLMNAIPAQLAGVPSLVMTTPPQPNGKVAPSLLVAADICGITEIVKVGGAQAIFALAFGTKSVPRVDKIVGPGNAYVTAAKQRVYGKVDIDKPAGPSEVLVVVEDTQYATFAASELLAQLEHDPEASAIVVSTNRACLVEVQAAFKSLFSQCKRQEVLTLSQKNARLILSKNKEESLEIINEIATEHLVLMLDNADEWVESIQNAGAIFMGPHTPVTLGDYFAGGNHVLPTAAAARFSSPLGVMDFMKFSSVLRYSKAALENVAAHLKVLTLEEGLDAHYLAVEQRLTDRS